MNVSRDLVGYCFKAGKAAMWSSCVNDVSLELEGLSVALQIGQMSRDAVAEVHLRRLSGAAIGGERIKFEASDPSSLDCYCCSWWYCSSCTLQHDSCIVIHCGGSCSVLRHSGNTEASWSIICAIFKQ